MTRRIPRNLKVCFEDLMVDRLRMSTLRKISLVPQIYCFAVEFKGDLRWRILFMLQFFPFF